MPGFPFEIAFSFAGSNRKLLERVALDIQEKLGHDKVYFDDWFVHVLHGRDMHHELERIYCEDSRMVVVCLSEKYSDRPWCKHELSVILDWVKRLDTATDRIARLRLAFLRFDSTSFVGVRDTDDAYFVSGKSAGEIADYLLKRHAVLKERMPRPAERPGLGRLLRWLRGTDRGAPTPGSRDRVRGGEWDGDVGTTLPSWVCGPNGAKMLKIPPGTFLMGTAGDRTGEERPHQVTIDRPFHLGVTPVTRGEWARVMGACPPGDATAGEDHPIVNVSWEDCERYCERLSERAGRRFRLPTEAEWEYACRAGSDQSAVYLWGIDFMQGRGWANLYDQSGKRAHGYNWLAAPWDDAYPTTSPVGQFRATPLGLRDMIGNVWEWCADWYGPYPAGPVVNPNGPRDGAERVIRGSSWFDAIDKARTACRGKASPSRKQAHIGFRLAAD